MKPPIEVPVFLALDKAPPEKPEESVISEAELQEPMTLAQIEQELEILNQHIEYQRELADCLRAERRVVQARHRQELLELGRRADEIAEIEGRLKRLRSYIYPMRAKARYEQEN
jgi:hypothetical protein